MSLLPQGLELDTKSGLEFCADSEEVYMDILDEFRKDDRRDELNGFFRERNWERYRISAHAVKSSSQTIGATDLYQIAKAIEEPLKDMDFGPALDLHELMIEKYTDVLNMLNRVLV
ncbi:MAG: Hpt domain-containing protein [Lachnospiraceae bacterium]|nr:Hpt domain-containing protein [Lachnospiraceae bacterium]